MHRFFYKLALSSAKRPWRILVAASACVVAAALYGVSAGIFRIDKDPVLLWAAENSPATVAKHVYDANFGPFYRIQQIILSRKNSTTDVNVTLKNGLRVLFDLENKIRQSSISIEKSSFSLADLCFRPFAGSGCVVQSVTGYWGHNSSTFIRDGDWRSTLNNCFSSPAEISCLPSFKQPLVPNLVVDNTEMPNAFISTFVNSNRLSLSANITQSELLLKAHNKWEEQIRLIIANASQVLAQDTTSEWRLSYSTESSIETEVEKSSSADFFTVIVSYVCMLLYILWHMRSLTLAGGCLAIVLASTVVGVIGAGVLGYGISFITLEAAPFLVLAIGVDNEFFVLEEHARVRFPLSKSDRIAEATASAATPGCLLCFACEFSIFVATAYIITVPVIRSFAICASIALASLFILQFTLFPAFMSICPRTIAKPRRTVLAWECYADIIGFRIKGIIIVLATCLLLFSLYLLDPPSSGLDQRHALPRGSYLVDYFNDLAKYYNSGPPVYAMLENVRIDNFEHASFMCTRFKGCRDDAVPNIVSQLQRDPEHTYLSSPSTLWFDDFLSWLEPSQNKMKSCCLVSKDDDTAFCDPSVESECYTCLSRDTWNTNDLRHIIAALPGGPSRYIREWLTRSPSATCVTAGAPYTDTVSPDTETYAFRALSPPLRTQDNLISAYKAHQRTLGSAVATRAPASVHTSVYSVFHVYFAQYDYLKVQLLRLIGISLLLSSISSVLFFGIHAALNMCVLLFCYVTILSCIVFGVVRTPLNAISVSNIVMAIGIGLEFCAHSVRAYAQARHQMKREARRLQQEHVSRQNRRAAVAAAASEDEVEPLLSVDVASRRAHAQLAERGAARAISAILCGTAATVLDGVGITKIIGTCVLAFARSRIFLELYFAIYAAAVAAGLMTALLIAPVYFYCKARHIYSRE